MFCCAFCLLVEASPKGRLEPLGRKRSTGLGFLYHRLTKGYLLSGTVESSPAKQLHKTATTSLRFISSVPYSAPEKLGCVCVQSKTHRDLGRHHCDRFGVVQGGIRARGLQPSSLVAGVWVQTRHCLGNEPAASITLFFNKKYGWGACYRLSVKALPFIRTGKEVTSVDFI